MSNPETELNGLRQRIDALDDQLMALLNERIGVVQQVAKLKAAHWPKACHIRSGREGRMHQRIATAFANSDFPAAAALAIWRQIIGASTHLESPLVIAASSPEQAAQAREYFGVVAEVKSFPTIAEALAAMVAKRCTILLATEHDLVVAHAMAPKLKIFAALPLNAPATLALAEIEPEASDHDVSYYLNNGHIETKEGFAPNDQWLGAHPRPPAF
jgi:chorismate mutase